MRAICVYDGRNQQAESFAEQIFNIYGIEVYDQHSFNPSKLDCSKILITLGGDGFLLYIVHKLKKTCQWPKIYPINYGTIGFLTNDRTQAVVLKGKVENAVATRLNFLQVVIHSLNGDTTTEFALNDVSIARQTGQASHTKISVNGKVRIENLVADGLVVCTPAGSTAYNFSVGGPIFNVGSNLLSVQPVAPFRPRYWRGALVSDKYTIEIEALQTFKRPISVNVDSAHFQNIEKVIITSCKENGIELLFDKDLPMEEKMLSEQFSI